MFLSTVSITSIEKLLISILFTLIFDKFPENYYRPLVKRHRFCMHCVPFILKELLYGRHNHFIVCNPSNSSSVVICFVYFRFIITYRHGS